MVCSVPRLRLHPFKAHPHLTKLTVDLDFSSGTSKELNLTGRGLEAQVSGQRIGYVRVSALDQNEKRQLEGQLLDRVFTDKA
jgi:hypothetical protein